MRKLALLLFLLVGLPAQAQNVSVGALPVAYVNALSYATGNGTTDDTSRLVTAIAATTSGGTLYFPCGTYLVSGSGAQVFLLTKTINIIAAGKCAQFTGSIGASTDLFHVLPGSGIVLRGLRFSNFAIATTGGNRWFNFDSTASTTSEMAEVEVDHIFTTTSPASHAIFVNNGATNTNGGTFNASFHDNYLSVNANNSGAIFANYAGDSLRIYDNILTGTGYAVYSNQISGAGQLLITGNNITASEGVRVDGGVKPIVVFNEIELSADNPTAAAVNFSGSVATVDGGTIASNQIQLLAGATSYSEAINLGTTANVYVTDNRITTVPAGLIGLNASGSATGTNTCNNTYSGFTTNVSGTTQDCIPTPGQLPGTTTNNNANSGNVGEYYIASTAETGLSATSSTVTITITSPAVVTWGTTIPFSPTGCAVVNFTTSSALPTGIVAGTNYFVIGSSISGNTFQIATTCDNAIAGTAINATGSQSGTQTGIPTAILSTGAALTLVGFTLPAGDWDVSSDIGFLTAGTTSVTLMAASTNTTTDTVGALPGQKTQILTAAQVPGVSNNVLHAGPRRYSFASPTKVYGEGVATFTASTMSGWGAIRARRVR